MKGMGRHQLILLAAFAVLAAIALAGGVAEAQQTYDDWTVKEAVDVSGETIVVRGALTVELGGDLYLDHCVLYFTNETPAEDLVRVLGTLTLDGTSVVTRTPGLMDVQGRLEVTGESRLEHMDVLVKGSGSLEVSEADLTLVGSYSDPRICDPLTVDVEGRTRVSGSTITLWYAFLTTQGSAVVTDSEVDASQDYQFEYEGRDHRVRFLGGATLRDSHFTLVWLGILSSGDIHVDGCTFEGTDVVVDVPWWMLRVDVKVSRCTFDASSVAVRAMDERSGSLDLDVEVVDTSFELGSVEVDLDEHYRGDIAITNVTITSHPDHAVVLRVSGFDGGLELDHLTVSDCTFGVLVEGDFSGMRVRGSELRVTEVAFDLTGPSAGAATARFEDVTLAGSVGISARSAHVDVVTSDLEGTGVPILGEGGAFLKLIDCTFRPEGAVLSVPVGGRLAALHVHQHIEIASVRWQGGGAIAWGELELLTPNDNLTDPPRTHWTIGSPEPPLVKVLEWSQVNTGVAEDTLLRFESVVPRMELGNHIFETVDALDPWEAGPFDLVFVDDKRPDITLDLPVPLTVIYPEVELHGTCGDVGTGLKTVEWLLEGPSGEVVASGTVEGWAYGRWYVKLDLTANRQKVVVRARDNAGNVQTLHTQRFTVSVPLPTLTILTPKEHSVTNEPTVTISGRAGWYATKVEAHIVGGDGSTWADVEYGSFHMFLGDLEEGFNEVYVTSYDPFDGTDQKYLVIVLDTTPPQLSFEGLDPEGVNHVTSPSLVIEGRTNDPRASIEVAGQVVGVLSNNTFATTVRLSSGLQTVRVEARDMAGNVEQVDLRIDLDMTAPVLELVEPASATSYTNKGEVDVVIEISEPLGQLTLDGEPLTVPTGVLVHRVTLASQGANELAFAARDLAGNEATLTVVIVHDTIPPELTVTTPPSGAVLNSLTVEVAVHASEGGCSLLADGTPLESTESPMGQLVATMYLSVGEGVRQVTLTLVDRAGNSAEETITLDIDTVKPFIQLLGIYPGMRVTSEPLKVEGTTEPGAKAVFVNGVMAQLDEGGQFALTIELVEGDRTITVHAIDRAGNEHENITRVKVLGTPDWEPPVEVLAAVTIILVLGAILASTEIGRWGFLVMFVALYTKLQRDKILDQQTRGLIQGYITANPGCNYTIIRDNLDLADGTLTYHLQVLEREGYIYSIREGLFRCFYPQGVPPPRRGKLHLSDTQMDIVRICKRIPGITVGEIATAMNRRPNVISYHLKLLREGGLVRMEEDGRHVRVFPVDTAVAMI